MDKHRSETGELREALSRAKESGHTHAACISIITTIGSSPRESGSKMLVTANESFGSIGGGVLENEMIGMVRTTLAQKPCKASSESIRVPLGPSLGQCCGGVVNILLDITTLSELGSNITALQNEVFPSDFQVNLFGAGHVGQALVNILGTLPCSVTWIDSRQGIFPRHVPANVSVYHRDDPEFEVPDLAPQSYCAVMTHSHPLDEKIVSAILRRDDIAYCGLIGSRSKALRFRKRLAARGLSDIRLRGLTCPIGDPAIGGKHPGEIAFALVSQILQLHQEKAKTAENHHHKHTALG